MRLREAIYEWHGPCEPSGHERRLRNRPATGGGPAVAVVQTNAQDEEIRRVSGVLRLHTRDTLLADRIARAFVIEGGKKNIDPALLIGVLLTEDATLDIHARSSVGARGLMQIMPFHSGKYGCVRGTNTPNCHTYPNKVLRYSRTAASQMVAGPTE